MANLSQIEKDYIKKNYKNKSVDDIVLKLKIEKKLVEEYIESINTSNTNTKEKIIKPKKNKGEDYFLNYKIHPYKIGKIDYLFAFLSFLATMIIYLLTLAPDLSAGDNGELATAVYFLGVGHAPGYPFYTIMCKLFTYIPINSIAWRTNLFSATCGALAVAFLYLILAKLFGQNRNQKGFSPIIQIPAFFGAFALALTDNMWAQVGIAKVYTLNILQIVTMLLVLVCWVESIFEHNKDEVAYYGSRYLMAFGFLYGVAFANHHVILGFAFAPLAAVAVVLFLVHKHRYIENIETSFISIFVFIFLICIGGFGYYRFIMSYESYLYFPPGSSPTDSIFSIIFKPFTDLNIFQDIISALANKSLVRPDMLYQLKEPSYPTLYKGLFLVFWSMFVMIAWFVIYKFVLCKDETSKFSKDNDYITGISFVFYQMLFALILGALVYAYMPIRARGLPPINWGQLNEGIGWENLSYLFSMIHRKQYGASGNDIAAKFILHPEQLIAIFNIYRKQLTMWALFFVIPGIYQAFKKNKGAFTFTLFGLITFSVSLMAYTNPPPSFRTLSFVEAFFLPGILYFVVLFAFGCQFYMDYANENIVNIFKKNVFEENTQIKFNYNHVISLAVLLVFLAPIIKINYKRNDNHNNYSNHDYSYNMMNSLPNNAIFATEGGDNQVFGLAYYTMVERRRPDLKIYDQKGNVFERIYGNLMKTDNRWIKDISDYVDRDFIEAGRPYYMAWKREGLERLGDYYFRPYGIVFRVLPIRYSLIDDLSFFKVLTVQDYKALAKKHLKREYEESKIARDLRLLSSEGLISVALKDNYNGNEEITFIKDFTQPFEDIKTDEEYWASYRIRGSVAEQRNWDFLAREIFVSSYAIARIEMYDRRIEQYNRLLNMMGNNTVARNGLTRDEIYAKIDEYRNLKKDEEEYMFAIGPDLSNVLYTIGSQAYASRNYERSIDMFERLIKIEQLIYPAYFNLAASYEALSKLKNTTPEKEKEYLEKAKNVLNKAERTFHRGKDIGSAAREQNQTYQQIKQYQYRIDLQIQNPKSKLDSMREQAVSENSFESYNSYASFVYQQRQDLEETLWAKEKALRLAKNKNDKMLVIKDLSILYANLGNFDMASKVLEDATKDPSLNANDVKSINMDLASLYFSSKSYDGAKNIYNKYTNDVSSEGAFALYALAFISIEEGDLQKALDYYDTFDRLMVNVIRTNQQVAELKKDADAKKLQIKNYLSSVGAN